MAEDSSQPADGDPIAGYKRLLRLYLDRRPSGLRGKIAEALGTHRSFVSQISNPAYAVPIPSRHLETIFRICHFSPEERHHFLDAYLAAHPDKTTELDGARLADAPVAAPVPPTRILSIELPVLADPQAQRELEEAIEAMARRMAALAQRLS